MGFMVAPSPPRRVSRRRKALAALVALVVIIGMGYYIIIQWQQLEGLLSGVPDNTRAMVAVQQDTLAAQGLDGEGIILCIVDTGADLNHPDLRAARLVAWKDLVNERPDPYDDEGHGTAMLGLIAGQGRVKGFSPGVSLWS